MLKVNIKRIYTTNIDDLFFNIYEHATPPTFLNDCSVKGVTYKDDSAVQYFPLHGCIKNDANYVFGATEIASAFSQRGNEQSWKSLANDAAHNPILFWGWNFDDSGPIEAMYGDDNNVDGNTNRWVLLRNPTEEMIDYIKSLRFNIIIGDTTEMLEYISNFVNSFTEATDDLPIDKHTAELLMPYSIPKNDSQLPSYPLKRYFLEYAPRWSHIYSKDIPKTSNYNKIADSISSGRDTIVMGIRCSGKTTLMMQLLAEYETTREKHIMVAPSIDQVKSYINILNGRHSILFIDDCFRDTDALILLFSKKNIQIVCFDRDFNYERQYHRIQAYPFNAIDVTEITIEDAQSIVNIIPTDLKRDDAGTKHTEKDPTIINLLAKNLKATGFKFITRFCENDPLAAKVFLMISYVHSCGTPCSFDMVYSFLGDDKYTWQDMFKVIERVGGLIKEASDWFDESWIIDGVQDYYQCRSRYLAEKIIASIPKGNETFAEMLNEFTKYVPAYKICLYDKFRRSAYDADFAVRAFPDIKNGEKFYELGADKDSSEYIYQQAAIYFSRLGDYKSAFCWIEKARNLAHYNRFSIDSTYAKIYFDVNLHANQEQAQIALDIMSDCCKNDKRKSIHFANFAKCCLAYYDTYGSKECIEVALKFLDEGLDDKNMSLSRKNKHELHHLKLKLTDVLR